MNRPPITGLILAGGQSRRFGSDKALHILNGVTMVERAFKTLSTATNPVLISVANKAQRYDIPARHVYDTFEGKGPLSGLHAGLQAANTSLVLVAAVDLPFIDASAIKTMLMHFSSEADAIVSTANGQIHPLFGCYRASLADLLAGQLETNQLSVIQFLREINTQYVALPAATLTNVNRPDDLK